MVTTDISEEQPPLQTVKETTVTENENKDVSEVVSQNGEDGAFKTLKYSLLGPSLLKAGQDKVDQTKVYILRI
jgi:DNA polymerase kappa